MNEPATREDLPHNANSIAEDFRRDMRRFEEQITNAIVAFGERMDRRFDAMDRRFDDIDRRIESMESGLGRLEGNVDRFAQQLSGFAWEAGQSDRDARILAIQAAQERYAAKHLGPSGGRPQ